MSLYTFTPSEVRHAIIECMQADLVPFVTSSPGLGKSSINAQIANDLGLEMIDLRLSQCAPEDLMGLPMRKGQGDGMRAAFAPFEMFPTEKDPLPPGKKGWMLNLDEFNSAPKSVQAAAYKIVLDRMVGQLKLHENVFIVCAGNLQTDKAIVTQMSTAMQSRLVHIEMVADHQDFMAHAVKNGFDYRILGFLEFQPSKLHAFDPNHNDRTFACPRTWEFASRLIKNKPTDKVNIGLLAGTLSDGVATELYAFMKEYDKIPRYGDIISNPTEIALPQEASTRYAVTTMLLGKFDERDFEKIMKYMKRMSSEFQAIFFRGLVRQDKHIRRHKVFIENIELLVKFLEGEDDDHAQAA